jgi:hypothetical protein
MKALWFAVGLTLLAVSALAPVARADGPRPSSANHWPGMRQSEPLAGDLAAAPAYHPAPALHYLWQEGYDRGGKWHGHWVPVQ